MYIIIIYIIMYDVKRRFKDFKRCIQTLLYSILVCTYTIYIHYIYYVGTVLYYIIHYIWSEFDLINPSRFLLYIKYMLCTEKRRRFTKKFSIYLGGERVFVSSRRRGVVRCNALLLLNRVECEFISVLL